jgi:hypothetical protein
LLSEPPVARDESTTPGLVDVRLDAGVPAGGPGSGARPSPTICARAGDVVVIRDGAGAAPACVDVQGLHATPGEIALAPATRGLVPRFAGALFVADLWFQRAGTLATYRVSRAEAGASSTGVIEVADPIGAELGAYESRLLVLGDSTINGLANPLDVARPGQVKRLRIVNGSPHRIHRLRMEGHVLFVIGTDGGLLRRPHGVQELLVAPGERVDVLVRCGEAHGTHRVLSLPYSRGAERPAPLTTLWTMAIHGRAVRQQIPECIDPFAESAAADATLPMRRFVLVSGGGLLGALVERRSGAAEHASVTNSDEVWDVANGGSVDVVWTQAMHCARVLSVRGGSVPVARYGELHARTGGLKDTVVVPAHGSVRMRVQARHFAGVTTYAWTDGARRRTGRWSVFPRAEVG